jgi:hypothetical protein
MVQCYAGGFAHTIFEHGKAESGLSDHARCGFFAQRHDRAAAGCTPDADEADYEEYSSYFWGALAGKSRDGKTVNSADYNADGRVSFAEAHAYAMIECDTIDVPVRTGGAFLRQYSELGPPARSRTATDSENDTRPDDAFAVLKGPLSGLVEIARPDQAAILRELPTRLGLGEKATVEEVQRRLRDARDRLAASDEKLAAASRVRRNALRTVRTELYSTWPELRAEYSPLAVELVTDRADEFVRHVEKLPEYGAFREAKQREQSLIKASLKLEREKARCERLVETCEEVVLAKNLQVIASPEIVNRYNKLLAMEEESLIATNAAAP